MCGEIAGRVKAAVLIGEAADRFDRALKASGFVNIKRASSLEEAVHASFSISDSGDKVLLSPACASFDMFKDYEDRGRSFKKIVMEIK
jgi:UDP-N-acetylmuramoylalanine--D-glutamate ligase